MEDHLKFTFLSRIWFHASSALYCLSATFEKHSLTQPTLLAWLRHSGFCCPQYTKDWHVGALLYFLTTKASLDMFTMKLAGMIWSPMVSLFPSNGSSKVRELPLPRATWVLGRSPIAVQALCQFGATFNSLSHSKMDLTCYKTLIDQSHYRLNWLLSNWQAILSEKSFPIPSKKGWIFTSYQT